MPSSGGDLGDDWPFKLLLTGVILMLMIPGLVIEPGPISELVGFGAIGAVWGLSFDGGGSR